ncbi:MAG: allantoinase AllB, partial [Synergistetes bacterium HGW-Synergistetes-2]
MLFDLVFRNGKIATGSGVFRGSIGVSGEKIGAVAAAELDGREVVDAEEMMLLPGFIDAHSHAGHGDPDRENFAAYSRACAAGGITTFIDMPL